MTGGGRRSFVGRPYRRLRRWMRHTPNGDIAVTMIALGFVLLLVAVLIAVIAL